MHASEAFVNGAADKGRADIGNSEDLDMINTLLSGTAANPNKRSPDEVKADIEKQQTPATRPGGFQNDPNDASNPNEVRERHLKKVKQTNND